MLTTASGAVWVGYYDQAMDGSGPQLHGLVRRYFCRGSDLHVIIRTTWYRIDLSGLRGAGRPVSKQPN